MFFYCIVLASTSISVQAGARKEKQTPKSKATPLRKTARAAKIEANAESTVQTPDLPNEKHLKSK